jgi:hypothetical protein
MRYEAATSDGLRWEVDSGGVPLEVHAKSMSGVWLPARPFRTSGAPEWKVNVDHITAARPIEEEEGA